MKKRNEQEEENDEEGEDDKEVFNLMIPSTTDTLAVKRGSTGSLLNPANLVRRLSMAVTGYRGEG